MFNLLSVFLVFAIFCNIHGHGFGRQLLSDADLQSALMPQELNPAFVPEKLFQDAPWRAVFPLGRQRRELEVAVDQPPPTPTISQSLKVYSRMATCVSLAIAAIVEIILYVVEFYTVS
ncbi:hypothetical protein B5X24_HaOG209318 [Helicoverpa armigera]|nr:hypothetical protein B5X24_HaOG209318 [Helicoverpa armigera]